MSETKLKFWERLLVKLTSTKLWLGAITLALATWALSKGSLDSTTWGIVAVGVAVGYDAANALQKKNGVRGKKSIEGDNEV